MGIEVHQQVMACAGLVPTQIQEDMVSEITMIVMKAVMEIEMMTGMVMVEIENGAKRMIIIMADAEAQMVMVKIIMLEIQMTAIAKMVTEMMITRQVGAKVTITMHQEIGGLTEEENTILMRMMIDVLLGIASTSHIHVNFALPTKRFLLPSAVLAVPLDG